MIERILCIIPSYNGASDLKRLLDSLVKQSLQFDIKIVDSGSIDRTQEVASTIKNNPYIIHSTDFNHGKTRQLMVDLNPEYDIYIFMTQDAYLIDDDALLKLVEPFSDLRVGAVCGRQLPHIDANPFAQHARYFNYPDSSAVKSIDDIFKLGLKTAFMSNSFAAYRRKSLLEVGGFPSSLILGEDMFVAARMILSGWKVAYSSKAYCLHSHNYSLFEEFSRYFDIGVFHKNEKWLKINFGGVSGEGFRYIKSEISFLGFSRFYLWPYSLLRNLFKFLGFKLGQFENYIPIKLKRILSMHKIFW